jgi:hypothetical protein
VVSSLLIADMHPPDDEINDVLRRLAASLLADMPRDGAAMRAMNVYPTASS